MANVVNLLRRMPKQYAANFVLSGITLNVQIFLMKFTNSQGLDVIKSIGFEINVRIKQ